MADYLNRNITRARAKNRVKKFFICDLARVHQMDYHYRQVTTTDPAGGYDIEGYMECDLCGQQQWF